MDESVIWMQLDSILSGNQRETNIQNDDDQYICACGGIKTFQYELPTCTTCGRVDDVFISDEAEWIGGPDSEDDPSRVGIPVNSLLYSGSWGMGTLIKGKSCQRMAKISLHSSMNHRDRALHHAYTQLDHICKGKLKLHDVVIEKAKVIYKKFNEEKLTRGAVRSGIKANCVLFACNEQGVSRSLQEIALAFDIPVKDISRTNEIFKSVTGEETGTTFSSDIISRLFNSVNFIPDVDKGRVRMKIIKACEESQNNPMLMGKTPKGVASAVIFKTLHELGYSVEREFISKICEVSVPTMIKIEKILKDMC
jgi:transcription initiation factor TFIIB